jgi:endoglucanase Acf2
MNKLTELYAMKKLPNIKKYIKYFYQYNEEFINSISSINYIPIKNYMYHLLLMSYIINNETLTIEIIKKIKSIMELIKNGTAFNSDTRKYIDTRLNLLRSLCK